MGTIINIKDVYYNVDNVNILKSCNLKVEQGEIMCVMGPNGCGKTTLLNCLLGFNVPTNGAVYLNDVDVRRMKRKKIAQTVSYVQQATQNDSSLEVYDYLSLGRIAHKNFGEVIDVKDHELIECTSEMVGIKKILHKSLLHLSGGEKQLVMVARALVQNTDIIVMDEPASALDFGNQSLLLQTIKDLNSIGKTIMFSTHNPNHALVLDAKSCIMSYGEIKMVGNANECISSGILKEIYGESVDFISTGDKLICSFNI